MADTYNYPALRMRNLEAQSREAQAEAERRKQDELSWRRARDQEVRDHHAASRRSKYSTSISSGDPGCLGEFLGLCVMGLFGWYFYLVFSSPPL